MYFLETIFRVWRVESADQKTSGFLSLMRRWWADYATHPCWEKLKAVLW